MIRPVILPKDVLSLIHANIKSQVYITWLFVRAINVGQRSHLFPAFLTLDDDFFGDIHAKKTLNFGSTWFFFFFLVVEVEIKLLDQLCGQIF